MISPAIASLADSALLLPASALLLLALVLLRQMRLALSLSVCLGLAGFATLGAKLLFHACGHAIADSTVTSPSGHVSFATIFYGAAALMFAAGRPRPVAWAVGAGTALLVLAVGISRVRTGAHSAPEVAVGLVIGGAALAAFAFLHARTGRPTLPWLPVVAAFSVAVLLLGGRHFSMEHRIGTFAREISAALDVCGPPDRLGLAGAFDFAKP